MKTITIQAEPREQTGKGAARASRREGRIPGTLYGQGKSVTLSVDRREFLKIMHDAGGDNVLLDVRLPGAEPLASILREVQHDVVSREVIHVDLQHIDMSKKIHVSVAVRLLGEPEGVRNFGGILEHTAREVAILCLPTDIPAGIDVDVSELMVGDSIHVRDLPAEGFEFLDDETKVIAQVAAPTVEKVAEEEGEEAEEGAEAPAEGEEAPAEGEKPADAKGDGE